MGKKSKSKNSKKKSQKKSKRSPSRKGKGRRSRKHQRNESMPVIVIFCMEILMLIIYAVKTEYNPDLMSINVDTDGVAQAMVLQYYPYFQDIHIMIFIGFGFLMVFLKSHSWTSVSYNLLVAAFSIQWAIITSGVWHQILGGSSGKL